jgi:hypothetical protein
VYQVPEGAGASAGKRKKEEKIKPSNEGSSNGHFAASKQDEVVRSILWQQCLFCCK